jgi:hypothetical protein
MFQEGFDLKGDYGDQKSKEIKHRKIRTVPLKERRKKESIKED